MTRTPLLPAVLSACLLAAVSLLPIAVHAAPLPLDKEPFSLTFPDGWDTLFLGEGIGLAGDSNFIVINEEMGEDVAAYGYGLNNSNPIVANILVNSLTIAYSTEWARTDSSNKKLGDYTFITTAFKDTSEDGDSSSRVRFYVMTEGDFLFLSWVTYDVENEDDAVEGFEEALATLEIKASTGLRPVPAYRGTVKSPRSLDVLGRIRESSGSRPARVPLFMLR